MAEVEFLFVPATEAGAGLIFVTLDGDLVHSEWWTWEMDGGWFGPIGVGLPSRTEARRRKHRMEPYHDALHERKHRVAGSRDAGVNSRDDPNGRSVR